MTKRCDGCGKPIRESQAHITANTATTRERWHLRCWPQLPRCVEFKEKEAEQ